MTLAKSDFEILARAIEAQMARKDQVDVKVGARELGVHSDRDRIVLVPLGGSLAAPPSGPFRRNGMQITPLHANTLTVVAHIQARNMRHLVRLWADLLSAVRVVFGRASTAGDYTIDTEGARAGFVHGEGASLSQAFTWELLLARFQKGSVEVDGTSVTGDRLVVVTNFDLIDDDTFLDE